MWAATVAGSLKVLAQSPEITQQPASLTVTQAQNAVFTVVATGDNLAYQWRFNETALAGATEVSFVVTNAQTANAGDYTVVVTNAYGAATSAVATLTVILPPAAPAAFTQPAMPLGATSALLCGMTVPHGATSLAWFQWGERGTYSETTSPVNVGTGEGVVRVSTVVSNLRVGATYQYRLVVSNAFGAVSSAVQWFTTGGRVVAWGDNSYGETNVPTWFSDATAIMGGATHSLALRAGGMVIAWGDNWYGQTNVLPGLSDAVALEAGWEHSLVLRASGMVAAWGDNTYGQTNVPAGLSNVVAVAGVGEHILALRADGTVASWGKNDYGQTNVPVGFTNIVAVGGGDRHSVVLRADGTVVAWGDNTFGQTNVPTGLTNVVAIAALVWHNLALRTDGTVVAWGRDVYSQTNVPAGLSNVVAVGGFEFNLALRADGTVIAWGRNDRGQTNVPSGLSGAVAVSGGRRYGLVLAEPGVPPSISVQPVSVTVTQGQSAMFTIGVSGTGPLNYQWQFNGTNIPGATSTGHTIASAQATNQGGYTVVVGNAFGAATSAVATLTLILPPSAPAAFTQPAMRLGATSALLGGMAAAHGAASTAWFQWGEMGSYNQTTIPVNVGTGEGVVRVSAAVSNLQVGGAYQCRLLVSNALGVTSGAVHWFTTGVRPVAWGRDDNGSTSIPAGLSQAVAIEGAYHNLAVRPDGTVAAWGGWNDFGQTTVPAGLTNVVAVACGQGHSLALKADGTLVAWGTNRFGLTDVPAGLTNVISVKSVYDHIVALRADGTVTAWGWNDFGQTDVPAGLNNVVAIAAGGAHSLALRADGTVTPWGWNDFGQTNVPAGLSNVVAVGAGSYHGLALKADGTVVAWGDNNYGQRDVPPGLSNVVAIATGGQHNLALKSDGTITAWGLSNYGRTTVPAGLSNVVVIAAGAFPSLALTTMPIAGVAPFITQQPVSTTVTQGLDATFTVVAGGDSPLSHQWRFGGIDIATATNSNFLKTNVQPSDAGEYTVVVTNLSGAVTSAVATLTVAVPPSISKQPTSLTVDEGQPAIFTSLGTGSSPIGYQWRLYSTNLPAATNVDYVVAAVQAANAGPYTVLVSNPFGAITSSVASLTVRLRPVVTQQPTNVVAFQGQPASFSVQATGEPTLSYQWRFNGTTIAGATETTFAITSAQSGDVGGYDVVVTNPVGAMTSVVATLSVLFPPTITVPPQSQTVWAGSNVTFSVTASGTTPFSYQWRLNGATLAAATNPSLVLTNIQLGQAGAYGVAVTNVVGFATSEAATLTVLSDASRIVRIIGTNAWAGGSVTVPVQIAAQGNENAMGFSVAFDTNLLVFTGGALGSGATGANFNFNTNQAAGGRVGLTLAMPTGTTFSAGTQEVARISFNIPSGVEDISAALTFGNQPVAKEVSDTGAEPLPATFVDGNISIGGGYEADVTPLPNGNGAVTITDWVKVGRYAAGLDALPSASQFQKADCAPRSTQGNGAISVSDWVQAGRYAAGLDPLAAAGGPTDPTAPAAAHPATDHFSTTESDDAGDAGGDSAGRTIQVCDTTAQAGQDITVPVQLIAVGDENALGFSLTFDKLVLGFARVTTGSGALGGTLNVNTNQLSLGRLGLALTLPVGATFPAGTQEIVRVEFAVATNTTGTTVVGLADQPVFREVSDALAGVLPASYQTGVLSITSALIRPLKLLTPQRGPPGQYVVQALNADGSMIESQRVAGISLWASTNVALQMTNWSKLTNSPLWTNGLLLWEDSGITNHPSRFYRAAEQR